MIAPWHDYPAGSPGAQIGRQQGRAHTVPMRRRVSLEVRTHRITAIAQASGAKSFFGDQWYALAHAPPMSIARSLSVSRSLLRNGSTACS